jgi:hypothetical protein
LIPRIKMDYYNPVVPEWTEEAYQRELVERTVCDVCLYVLTPKIAGYYSIAEVADDSNKRPHKTVFCILLEDDGLQFDAHQYRSLQKVGKIVTENGGYFCEGMEALVQHLRSRQQVKANS